MKAPLILRCAALLVPSHERLEWLSEWSGEFAYVRRTCDRTRTIAFCFGALPDALWLRRNVAPAEKRGILNLESPSRCLSFLAVLAAASVFFAIRLSPAQDAIFPAAYRDADNLAMVSRRADATPRFAEIPIEEYRLRANGMPDVFDEVAFYAPILTWVHSRQFLVAVASPNLFDLLGVPVSGSGLILSRTAWRRYFKGDPHIVGRTVPIAGQPVTVTGIVSDGSWQLPGAVDGWLLDERRLAERPTQSKGFMVARLRTAASRSTIHWLMSTPNERGSYGSLTLAPLPRPQLLVLLLVVVVAAFLLLSPTTSLALGEYPASRHSPGWRTRTRRWTFLAVKIALLLPIVFCGCPALCFQTPLAAQGLLFCCAVAIRWALRDQRSRCPVCLRSLSHPVRIGEASHTFLEWYGTELLCVRGHGFLHVPEIRTSCYAGQRWMYLEAG